MPIFDFACQQCHHVFEKLCLPGREAHCECPMCQSTDVKKKVSASGLQFQGAGWYRDGYGLEATSGGDT